MAVSTIMETFTSRSLFMQKHMIFAKSMQALRSRCAGYLQRASVVLVLAALVSLGLVGVAVADQPSSAHYKVTETQFGAGSSLRECSDAYCAKTSAGDTVVGSSRSDNYAAEYGFNTSDVPVLEVIATVNSEDMGVLDTDRTGTAVSSVKVRSYLSSGYIIQVAGNAPDQGSHILSSPTTPQTSQQGHEQFGLNLAANDTPDVGADPVQVPSSQFSFGQVDSNYNQSDKFMYQDSDIVARSLASSGETDYTLSFIANVTNTTPAGRYLGNYSAVVVPMF
jgi:hypothetical protein